MTVSSLPVFQFACIHDIPRSENVFEPKTIGYNVIVIFGSSDDPVLGLPRCDMAAFSEHARIWAKATNGWRKLSAYDVYDHGAFVLAPKTTIP